MISRLLKIFDALFQAWPTPWGGARLRRFFWRARFKSCGCDVFWGEGMKISEFKNISVGEGSSFMDQSYLYAEGDSVLEIGSRCSFNHQVFFGATGGQIKVGNNVLIGPNVVLRAANHVFSNQTTPIRDQKHSPGKITIEDDVWISANVVITSNVTIGRGCVVGAGSVVTRDLPAMTICYGSPAVPHRNR